MVTGPRFSARPEGCLNRADLHLSTSSSRPAVISRKYRPEGVAQPAERRSPAAGRSSTCLDVERDARRPPPHTSCLPGTLPPACSTAVRPSTVGSLALRREPTPGR